MNGVRHFLLAVQFFTRIPVTGRLAHWVGYSPAMLRASAAHFPGVGWLVGALAAGVLWLAAHGWAGNGAGAWVAAVLASAATVWLTGAFHEDGLADTADGLGGSVARERALDIMKDSRIGSYGTVALVLALGLKVALTAALLGRWGAGMAALLVLGAHVLSRLAPLLVMRALPYVGEDGRSKSKPLADSIGAAGLLAAGLWCLPALLLLAPRLPAANALAALLLALGVVGWMVRLLRRRLGGFVGDNLGATQQLTELALLLGWSLQWPAA